MMPLSVAAGTAHAAARNDAGTLAELQRLRDELDELRRVVGLEAAEAFPAPLPRTQRVIFGLLIARGFAPRSLIYAALYGGRPDCDWPLDPARVVWVEACRLRRALVPHGITFRSVRSGDDDAGGYMMDRAMRARCCQLMAGARL